MSERITTIVPTQEQTPEHASLTIGGHTVQVTVDPEPEAPTAEPTDAEPEQEQDAEADATAEPEPTSTLAEANRTLSRFGTECRNATDHNYKLAELASLYVEQFLGAAPGKSQRSTAVDRLATEWLQWDEESLAVPQNTAMKRLRERVNMLLRCNGVVSVFGDGSQFPAGDGTGKGRGKGKPKRFAWGTLRELAPLVERTGSDEFANQWSALSPTVEEQGKELVREAATGGMARADVCAAVARICSAHFTAKLEQARTEGAPASTIKPLEAMVERWGGKVERQEAKERQEAPPTESAPSAGIEIAPPTTDAEVIDAEEPAEEPATSTPSTPSAPRVETSTPHATRDTTPAEKPEPAATQAPTLRHLLSAAKQATPKDLAEQLATMLFANDDPIAVLHDLAAALLTVADESTEDVGPDDALEAMLNGFASTPACTRKGRRAIDAARMLLSRKDAPTAPVSEPSTNGHVLVA